MPDKTLIDRTFQYVLSCQCHSGGFCFYRLEEPNGSDTYFALAILNLLGKTVDSSVTRRFLKSSQKSDGTYDNLYQAFYAIRGLGFMNESPSFDPRPYIGTLIRRFPVENATLETQLRRLNLLTDLCDKLGIQISPQRREPIVEFILSYQNKDRGFGSPFSTLLCTSYAVTCLDKLKHSVSPLGVIKFLQACENPIHGFLNVPDTAPSFLEHLLSGIIISRTLGYTPRYTETCRRFITHCQSSNGGFARAPKGLPSLQDTYHAVLALTLLETTT